jgi:hypothetical protein
MTYHDNALALMKPFSSNLVIQQNGDYANCPCRQLRPDEGARPDVFFLLDGQVGIRASFSYLPRTFNYSDPAINGSLSEREQENYASRS